MNRSRFLTQLGAASATLSGLASGPVDAASFTIDAALAGVPAVRPGSWVQYIMGSGVVYSKKVGFGRERTQLGTLPFIETQIGDAQATCNPNTIKKAYIERAGYGDLLAPHDVKLYVVKAGTAFSVLNTDASDKLYLLDADNLYTTASARAVTSRVERFHLRGRTLRARRIDLAFPSAGKGSLRELTLWVSPAVPLGVVKMHAAVTGAEPFDLHLDSFGDGYFSLVPESLDALRRAGS